MDLTGSQAAIFWVLSPQPRPDLTSFRYLNFHPVGMKYYLDHMAALDPTNHYLISDPDERIVHDGLVISERQKDRHPYYDWQCKLSDARYRMVGQARRAPSTQAGVALHRTRHVGRFGPGDIERFAFVHRHMAQALSLGFRLGTLGTMQKCTAELLDRSPAAILLLDERKRVVFLNRGAQALQTEADGVRLSADGLTLDYRQDNDRLQRLIAQAFTALPAGYAMRALRPSGKRPYGILVGPGLAEIFRAVGPAARRLHRHYRSRPRGALSKGAPSSRLWPHGGRKPLGRAAGRWSEAPRCGRPAWHHLWNLPHPSRRDICEN